MGRSSHAQERLLTVAARLLQIQSYGTVGVDAICKKAGVNKGSFYYFYPAKSDLVVAVMERAWDEFRQQILEPSLQAPLPAGQRWRRFFDAVYEHHRRQQLETGHVGGCLFGNLGCELSGREETIRQKAEQILGRIEACFRQALTVAVEEGLIRNEDLALTTKAFMAYWQGLERLAKLANNAETIRDASAWLLLQLARTVAAGPTPAAGAAPAAPAGFTGALDFLD